MPVQDIIEKVGQLRMIGLGFVEQAGSALVGSASEEAETLSLDEMSGRLDRALDVLAGKEVAAKVQRTPLEVAEEMVASYIFNPETGVSTFTIPAGVTDIEAMKAINEYFRQNFARFNRDAIHSGDFTWYKENLEQRDATEARDVTITAIVQGTADGVRTIQEDVLKDASLVPSDERDQAMAAGLHACRHNNEDLFKRKWVRGSLPESALSTRRDCGVRVDKVPVTEKFPGLAMSGSPSPKSK